MRVVLIDNQMGNLGSVRRALEELGAEVIMSRDPRDIAQADRTVLPGVGSFRDGISNLRASGWDTAIRKSVSQGRPLLGICLGMQLLADKGLEGGENEGLGLIPGEVRLLTAHMPTERIPHVGWNEVYPEKDSGLLEGIHPGTDFYFVHSYHFLPRSDSAIVCRTPYCGGFISGVSSGSVFGVQFHPEKSSRPGLQLLRNFLNI